MSQLPRATIVFYNVNRHQLQLCTVPQTEVQSVIDRRLSRGLSMNLPLSADDEDTLPITDDVLRQIGGVAVLSQGIANPELRARFQFDTPGTMEWGEVDAGRPKPKDDCGCWLSAGVYVTLQISRGVGERTWSVLAEWHGTEARASVVTVWPEVDAGGELGSRSWDRQRGTS